MKSKLFVVAMFVAVVAFTACPGDKKSSETGIESFTVHGVSYTVDNNAGTLFKAYPKPSQDTWTDLPGGPSSLNTATYVVTLKHEKATHNLSGTRDFRNPVQIIVTAEDGATKTYTVTSEVGEL